MLFFMKLSTLWGIGVPLQQGDVAVDYLAGPCGSFGWCRPLFQDDVCCSESWFDGTVAVWVN